MNRPEELLKRIVQMSRGVEGVIAIRLDDWQAIRDAYGNTPLLTRIGERVLSITPVASVETAELGWE